MDTSKPPHQVLERYWFTRGSGGDNLSLDQKLRRLHLRLCKIDNLRNTICYIRQSSAEDPHLLVFSVDLDSRPVELVLESGSILVLSQNLLRIVCHLCQHWFDWDEQAKIDPFQSRCAPRHSQASDVADIAVQHVCSTN